MSDNNLNTTNIVKRFSHGKPVILLVIFVIVTGLIISGCQNQTADNMSSVLNNESAQSEGEEKISVVASFYPMHDFAARIGGSQIDLVNLVPSGVEPHSWEPSAEDIIKLETADVFVYNGAGMEHWVDTVLAAVSNEDLIVVETAAGISLREGHSHEHDEEEADNHEGVDHEDETHGDEEQSDEEHNHGDSDPHVWLDPLLAIEQMSAIRDAFIAADPQNKDLYNENFQEQKADFEALDREFHSRLDNLANRDLIVAHEAYGYLAAAYDLNQIAISGLSPENEPSPARMAEIIDIAETKQIKVIFFEELVSPKVAQTIADAADAQTAVLSTLEGLTAEQHEAGEDYISVMKKNLEMIERYLGDK